MADLSQTAANVAPSGNTTPTTRVQYGENVTQGNALYRSTTDSKWYKCDADTAAKAYCDGIAITPGSTNDYGIVVTPGSAAGESLINLGATLTVGEVYILSTNAGAIRPIGDLASTQYGTVIGVAKTAALLDYQVVVATVAKA